LDEVSESVYRLLLRSPGRSRDELAEELGQDERDVEEAISRLVSLSLIRRSWEADDRLVPLAPDVAVGALLAEQEKMVLRQQEELGRHRVAMARLLSEYQPAAGGYGSSGVERLEGIDAVRGRLDELARRAVFETIAFNMNAHTAEGLEAGRQLDQEALERGVALRGMYLESVRNHPPTRAHARWLTEAGAEVRTAPTLPLMMIVVDRATGVLPIDPEEPGAGAVVITEKGVVTALCALFEQCWATGAPFGEGQDRDDEGLAASEREVLRLLALGMTDEAASRMLGVSLRTIRRMMSDLTERLDARSRFQAGVVAAKRGWI
jgi:DNA-binding CsgD family transcriptional regulator